MNTKVNGMCRKDLFMDIIKKNASKCSFAGNLRIGDPMFRPKWWSISFRRADIPGPSVGLSKEEADIEDANRIKIAIKMSGLSQEMLLVISGKWIMNTYDIEYEQLLHVLNCYPRSLKARSSDLDILSRIYLAMNEL